MRYWTTATSNALCAFDGGAIRTGDRVYVLDTGLWRKVFCAGCGVARHQAPADTGETPDGAVGVPPLSEWTPLRSLVPVLARVLPFDHRAAAAGKDGA